MGEAWLRRKVRRAAPGTCPWGRCRLPCSCQDQPLRSSLHSWLQPSTSLFAQADAAHKKSHSGPPMPRLQSPLAPPPAASGHASRHIWPRPPNLEPCCIQSLRRSGPQAHAHSPVSPADKRGLLTLPYMELPLSAAKGPEQRLLSLSYPTPPGTCQGFRPGSPPTLLAPPALAPRPSLRAPNIHPPQAYTAFHSPATY